MVEISISELSKHPKILDELDDIARVVNKKEGVIKGIFIPIAMKKDIEDLLEMIAKRKKEALLKRVAKAQQRDKIGDGAVGDGL